MIRTHLINPHGHEADSARWAARREKRGVVDPPERQVTQQRTRRVASRMGFDAQVPNTSLRALPMTTGIGRGLRLVYEPVRLKRGS